jgi:hypothetical protein
MTRIEVPNTAGMRRAGRSSRAGRWLATLPLLLIVGGGLWTWLTIAWAYAEGERAGVLQKFVRRRIVLSNAPDCRHRPLPGRRRGLARQQLQGLAAIHLNLPILFPPPPAPAAGYTAAEQAAVAQLGKHASDGSVCMALETLRKERRGSIRDTDDLVGCLPIEFKVELSSRLAVIPVGEMLELAAPHWPLR